MEGPRTPRSSRAFAFGLSGLGRGAPAPSARAGEQVESPARRRSDTLRGEEGTIQGLFLSFEGGEGAGKSTQAARLADALAARGVPVELVREPGGTALGEAVRAVLLERRETPLVPAAEALLYLAARAQLVRERILPALAAGRCVVADRFADSTLAYQAFGLGEPIELVESANGWATAGRKPDRTYLLDLDPEVGLERHESEHPVRDRIEARGLEYHQRVREGYRRLARAETGRFLVLAAEEPVERLHAIILEDAWRLWCSRGERGGEA
ncbi:MAG: dTMP kinase [Bacillota bacterium]|nr:dTMP kinase [Bacillota bacterium]